MTAHLYVYVTIGLIAVLLSWVCDKRQFIKSKPLRNFVVIMASTLIAWMFFDLILGTE